MSAGTSSDRAAARALRPPPAAAGMRIGLLGGSFNPPHEGHRHITLEALKRLGLDRVWWLVTPGNPLKSPRELAAFSERLEAARRLARHPRIDVTGLEAARPSAYTVDTLAFLTRRFPNVHFVWLMGADNMADFHRWKGWRQILETMPIAVLDRPGYRLAARAAPAAQAFAAYAQDERDAAGLATMPPPAWTLLTLPLSPHSSTAIRAGASPGD